MNLASRQYWIFDMDGTLTHPIHDFAAIRAEIGVPEGLPILEYLDEMPTGTSELLHTKLYAIEHDLASRATRPDGVLELLVHLRQRGARLGIVTRNRRDIAYQTLEACGLDGIFSANAVIGREQADPKPEPDGIHLLLRGWGATPSEAVMVGDFLYDLQAGRAAGTATVYVDSSGEFPWASYADRSVEQLDWLLADLA
jgi:HAD superfamily hydrolase (TIGR01509 family)